MLSCIQRTDNRQWLCQLYRHRPQGSPHHGAISINGYSRVAAIAAKSLIDTSFADTSWICSCFYLPAFRIPGDDIHVAVCTWAFL